MVEGAMKMLEDVAMTRIDGLKAEVIAKDKTIAAQDLAIKCLQERIASLEEANASRGETRPITKEEWAENFK
jgi:hypothetical protein